MGNTEVSDWGCFFENDGRGGDVDQSVVLVMERGGGEC